MSDREDDERHKSLTEVAASILAQSGQIPQKPAELTGDHHSLSSTPFTVFDYLGLAFILGPPGVAVEALMKGEVLSWSYAIYGLPSVLIGALCIYIGRNWKTLRKKVWIGAASSVDKINKHSYFIAIIALSVFFALLSIAPLYIWAPNRSAQVARSRDFPTATEIAGAIVPKLPAPLSREDIAQAVAGELAKSTPPAPVPLPFGLSTAPGTMLPTLPGTPSPPLSSLLGLSPSADDIEKAVAPIRAERDRARTDLAAVAKKTRRTQSTPTTTSAKIAAPRA